MLTVICAIFSCSIYSQNIDIKEKNLIKLIEKEHNEIIQSSKIDKTESPNICGNIASQKVILRHNNGSPLCIEIIVPILKPLDNTILKNKAIYLLAIDYTAFAVFDANKNLTYIDLYKNEISKPRIPALDWFMLCYNIERFENVTLANVIKEHLAIKPSDRDCNCLKIVECERDGYSINWKKINPIKK